jgi:hypothetical protein
LVGINSTGNYYGNDRTYVHVYKCCRFSQLCFDMEKKQKWPYEVGFLTPLLKDFSYITIGNRWIFKLKGQFNGHYKYFLKLTFLFIF